MRKIFLSFTGLLIITSFQTFCLGQQKIISNPCPIDADLWVLAGQSNMDGNGRTPDTLTNSNIMMLGLDNRWVIAQNPLHHAYDAAAPAYELTIMGFPWYHGMSKEDVLKELQKKREESKIHPIGGVGPGIYFARHIFEETGKPIGLIPCALGGTTMEQWSPDKKPGGDSTLYGAMSNRIKAVGRHLKGFIWFQGESEAMAGNTQNYKKDLLRLIDTVRKDADNTNLPVIIVQIGCFNNHNAIMDKGYEEIREIQRTIIKERKNLYVVAGIDLPLDDWAHISTEGQQRLGKRIAEIVLSYVYNLDGHAKQIDLESIKMCKNNITGTNYLHVNFKGLRGKLNCCGRPAQFELRVNGGTNYEYVVSKIELDENDPSGLNLFLSKLPEASAQLVFGPGTNPYMNITDSFDNALPAFGPVDVPLK
jgi:sialate O-acetylesterase